MGTFGHHPPRAAKRCSVPSSTCAGPPCRSASPVSRTSCHARASRYTGWNGCSTSSTGSTSICWGKPSSYTTCHDRVAARAITGQSAPHHSGAPTDCSVSGGVEAHLQQLQSVVVVLPEEVLQTGSEQAHGRRAARQLSRAPRDEGNGRERAGHVAELALARPAHEDLVLGRAQDRRHARDGIDERRAGGDFGLSTRRAERAGPDGVGAWNGEGKRGFAVGPVLVEHFEHAVGRLTEQNLRRNGVAGAAPEVNEDDVAAPVPIHVGILVVRDADDVEIEMRAAGRAVARRGLLRGGPGGRGHRGRHSGSQEECETHKSSLESVRGRSDREKHQALSATSRARRGVLEPGCPTAPSHYGPTVTARGVSCLTTAVAVCQRLGCVCRPTPRVTRHVWRRLVL